MKKITITVSNATHAWLERESASARKSPTAFLNELLADLADPDQIEIDLIDRLLISCAGWFPPIMELEEQVEMRVEVLDSLCYQIRQQYTSQIGVTPSEDQLSRLRERLAERADICWQHH
jgi:hypothetical protein